PCRSPGRSSRACRRSPPRLGGGPRRPATRGSGAAVRDDAVRAADSSRLLSEGAMRHWAKHGCSLVASLTADPDPAKTERHLVLLPPAPLELAYQPPDLLAGAVLQNVSQADRVLLKLRGQPTQPLCQRLQSSRIHYSNVPPAFPEDGIDDDHCAG